MEKRRTMPMIGVVLVLMLEVGETLVFECSLPIKTTAATISISKDDATILMIILMIIIIIIFTLVATLMLSF